MGCFLGCFGTSKDRKRRKQGNKVRPRDQKSGSYKPVQHIVSSYQDKTELPVSSVSEFQDKVGEELGLSGRKKVTFDSNVRTYEHVSNHEITDHSSESEERGVEKGKADNLAKLSQSDSHSEDGSITSSLGSYPPNHRYQNCRDSDDEVEELEYEESDLDDDEEEEEEDEEDDYNDYNEELRTRICAAQVITEEVDNPMLMCGSPEREVKAIGSNRNARDRSAYVHSVLNPVENLTQWKAVKAKGTTPLKHQKENFTLDQEPCISFSLEPSFKQSSSNFKSKSEHPKHLNQEIAVDTSLSNWLVSSESTPINKASTIALETTMPERSMSQGSNSLRSMDDRPILGALTVEELKQFSASSSPRRSPSRSPDEMPIIGTVGTYWSHTDSDKDSGSVSSYKGIPNTTSKYREDKRVNWHSTPFEARLERALNRGVAEACLL
ncbi:hypothetical protein L1049_027077 [Liquidambar formosana]|uniref:Uncharacterized protein n=1 Tax=Liquidambar formosana TaxID=63359 RepID=A0AAP0R235_LIQFO